jgi:hypothetical protein
MDRLPDWLHHPIQLANGPAFDEILNSLSSLPFTDAGGRLV